MKMILKQKQGNNYSFYFEEKHSITMKKIIILLSFLLFSHYPAQSKVEKLSEITEEVMRLYVKDTLKRPFKYGG